MINPSHVNFAQQLASALQIEGFTTNLDNVNLELTLSYIHPDSDIEEKLVICYTQFLGLLSVWFSRGSKKNNPTAESIMYDYLDVDERFIKTIIEVWIRGII